MIGQNYKLTEIKTRHARRREWQPSNDMVAQWQGQWWEAWSKTIKSLIKLTQLSDDDWYPTDSYGNELENE